MQRLFSAALAPQMPQRPSFSRRNAHLRCRVTGRSLNSSLILLRRGIGGKTVTILVGWLFGASIILAGPTPAPTLAIAPTGTVRFVWAAPETKTAAGVEIPAAVSYDFVEKTGTSPNATYKLLGNTTAMFFEVKNIGAKPRVFGIVARSKDGPGSVKEFIFPGMAGTVKGYLEVQVK
jgi:hypothetical protein